MEQTFTVLGIDLGACMSGNSAYVYAEIPASLDNIKIIETLKEPKHKDHLSCRDFLHGAVTRHDVDAIAIDAPLSLPKALTDPQFPQKERKKSGEIANPYLYRYTDYFLYERFGLKPMPPAGDRIGRLTARAIGLLQAFDYAFPCIEPKGKKIPVYEVYPKQIAHSLGQKNYKKEPQKLLGVLNPDRSLDDIHLIDALLCCFGAANILQGKTVWPDAGIEEEGWCFPVV
jgi:predicted nuclease with RNAse H fold